MLLSDRLLHGNPATFLESERAKRGVLDFLAAAGGRVVDDVLYEHMREQLGFTNSQGRAAIIWLVRSGLISKTPTGSYRHGFWKQYTFELSTKAAVALGSRSPTGSDT